MIPFFPLLFYASYLHPLQHAKQPPPTPTQSMVNLLEDDSEPCTSNAAVPSTTTTSTTTIASTTRKQSTNDSCVDSHQTGVTPSQGSRKLAHTQASAHLTRDSASSSKAEEDLDAYWESEVAPLLRSLEEGTSDVAQLCEVSGTLWSRLEGRGLLGRSGGNAGTKRRAATLRTLFKLLDHTDSHLLLRLARIILAVSCSTHVHAHAHTHTHTHTHTTFLPCHYHVRT